MRFFILKMTDEEQRKRLELEMRFLNESLEADIISKEEYSKGKERIERKLSEIEENYNEFGGEDIEPNQDKEEIEIKEIEKADEGADKKIEKIIKKRIEKEKPIKEKKESKIFKKLTVIILFAVIIGLIILGFSSQEHKSQFLPYTEQEKIANKITDEIKEPEIELTVINDKNCKLCDSSRIEAIVKGMFQNVNISYIDSEEAKEMIEQFGIDAIPSYIFSSNINETINFNDFKRTLIKKENNYLMSNTASGANYYFEREQVNNKIELFLTTDTEDADKNIQDFLDVFRDEIKFTKHFVKENEKAKLKEELGINSYPVFLINNQFKVGGFQSSNSLKEKFCELNRVERCVVG